MKLSAIITAAIVVIAVQALPVVHQNALDEIHARSGSQVDLGITLQLLKRDTYSNSAPDVDSVFVTRATSDLPDVAYEQPGALAERAWTEAVDGLIPKAIDFFKSPPVAKDGLGTLPTTRWWQPRRPTMRMPSMSMPSMRLPNWVPKKWLPQGWREKRGWAGGVLGAGKNGEGIVVVDPAKRAARKAAAKDPKALVAPHAKDADYLMDGSRWVSYDNKGKYLKLREGQSFMHPVTKQQVTEETGTAEARDAVRKELAKLRSPTKEKEEENTLSDIYQKVQH